MHAAVTLAALSTGKPVAESRDALKRIKESWQAWWDLAQAAIGANLAHSGAPKPWAPGQHGYALTSLRTVLNPIADLLAEGSTAREERGALACAVANPSLGADQLGRRPTGVRKVLNVPLDAGSTLPAAPPVLAAAAG